MTDDATIWNVLRRCVPKKKWIPLQEIVATVRIRLLLDREDLERRGSSSGLPRWESNVRRLLRAKAQVGSIRSRKRAADRPLP
jgi:hypothetical protein